jgi:hypothetical protein
MTQTTHASLDADNNIEPSALRDASLRMALALDAGHGQQVWRGASAAVKDQLSCEDFARAVAERRQAMGTVRRRDWYVVSRTVSTGTGSDELPAGIYACSEFEVTFDGDRTGREVVSFRLDEDGVWRFVGNHLECRDWATPA